MTIKEYLKTLKEKDIIVIEPSMSEIRKGNKQAYVNSVRHLLKLDPPALKCEYNGCSDVAAINGTRGKLIIYKTSTPQASPMGPICFGRLAKDIVTDDVVSAVADYLDELRL